MKRLRESENMNIQTELRREYARLITRRWFLRQCGVGLGSVALASLLGAEEASAAAKNLAPANPINPKQPHYKGKAKRVIFIFMAGAPNQLELFDSKPTLTEYNGKPLPPEVIKDQKYAFIK